MRSSITHTTTTLLAISSTLLTFPLVTLAAESKPKPAPRPCTIHSPSSGSFYDLTPLQLYSDKSPDGTKIKVSGGTNESYHARGYDYASNFTLNFCAPVVEDLRDVEDVPRTKWANVSAYYTDKRGDIFSIGLANDVPTFRGKKLVLNYTGGSICPDLDEDGDPIDRRGLFSPHLRRKLIGGDDDDDDDDNNNDDDGDDDGDSPNKPSKTTTKSPSTSKPTSPPSSSKSNRRKSTLISLICDTSPLLSNRPAISFLGSLDHCTYVFEVRSRWACPGATPSGEKGTLGPGAVFGVILGIAVAVYLAGGIVYQRNVMHQRGWRQLPNYGVWAGAWSFVSDMFTILFSSCTRRAPSMSRLFGSRATSKHSYHRVGGNGSDNIARNGSLPGGGGNRNGNAGAGVGAYNHHSQSRTAEDENRLIDSYDEEWD